MKLEWMPPLPDKFPGEVKQWMLDYALAAVEAYKASLKPVAWALIDGDGRWLKACISASSDEEMLTLGYVPLYRLDG